MRGHCSRSLKFTQSWFGVFYDGWWPRWWPRQFKNHGCRLRVLLLTKAFKQNCRWFSPMANLMLKTSKSELCFRRYKSSDARADINFWLAIQESEWMCAKSLDRNSCVPMREDLNSQWKLSGFWPFYTLSKLAEFLFSEVSSALWLATKFRFFEETRA